MFGAAGALPSVDSALFGQMCCTRFFLFREDVLRAGFSFTVLERESVVYNNTWSYFFFLFFFNIPGLK